MPLLDSTFSPRPYLRGGHLQTILPSVVRRVDDVAYERERIATPDGDFLDLDWVRSARRRVVIVSHGLEGNSSRAYVRGMARALRDAGFDVLAWNYRGCSGEPNRLLRSYHSGASDDLGVVIEHVASLERYDAIALVGFSLGGNITLKYLGETGDGAHPLVRAAVAFSVPADLASSAHRLAERANAIYMRRFLTTLRAKMLAKASLMPPTISLEGIDRVRTFLEFDDRYTAPIHGYRDGPDYWTRASSRPLLAGIRRPTLLVNALDDPFLTPQCMPFDEARASEHFHFEAPAHGGHVGFMERWDRYWSEARAVAFLRRWIGHML
ncbi:MAG TPA: alpha/beta fold hydrolase [Candidatus Kapabacteria bacterium]|nr:alpha/beta fold hydrolase [Candidatus Kapabacteria bacterium]